MLSFSISYSDWSILYWDLIKCLYFTSTPERGDKGWKEAQRQGYFMDDSNETKFYIFSSFVISLNFSIDRQFFKNLTFQKVIIWHPIIIFWHPRFSQCIFYHNFFLCYPLEHKLLFYHHSSLFSSKPIFTNIFFFPLFLVFPWKSY